MAPPAGSGVCFYDMKTALAGMLLLPLLIQDADELKRRATACKEEEKAHAEKKKAAEAARKKDLADKGIVDVAALDVPDDPARSLDAVFIGDGFTKEEQPAYNDIIDRMAKNFDTPPFSAHRSRVNLYRVNLVSPASGIAEEGASTSTPLKGTVKGFSGGKLLACDVGKAVELARAAVPHLDFILAVLNTHEKFVGSANTGQIVILSTAKPHQGSLVMHEFGHNIDAILDEYVDGKQSGGREPPAAIEGAINVTLESNVFAAKWHHWNVPQAAFKGEKRGKPFEPEDNVRCYEGAATYHDKVYRAEENCHMQRGRGKEFCRVCREGLEISLARWFTPIDAVWPASSVVKARRGQALDFIVTPLPMPEDPGIVRVSWYVDGARAKGGKPLPAKPPQPARWTFTAKDLAEGVHHVTVAVDLDSPRVHMDRGRMSGSFTWTVEVTAAGPRLQVPKTVSIEAGAQAAFAAVRPEGAAPGEWMLADPPPGATYDGASGQVAFTPPQAGAWRLTFVQRDRDFAAAESTLVVVNRPDKAQNQPPKFVFLPEQEGKEGAALEFDLSAWDPDGDHLAWACSNLPEGAQLDANTGKFRWTPGSSQRGAYSLEFTANDGGRTEKRAVAVRIQGAPLYRGIFKIQERPAWERAADFQLGGLHDLDPKARAAAAARLAEAPAPIAVSHALRLARDSDGAVARAAWELLLKMDAAALDLFLDQMPRVVWQFVDAPQRLTDLAALCKRLQEDPRTGAARIKELAALIKDIELIEQYNKDRKARAPKPPVTDKKFN